MDESFEVELTEDTVIKLPTDLHYNIIGNVTLIISKNQAKWIALFNEEQVNIFQLIVDGKTLGEIQQESKEVESFNFVISQIYDRNFLAYNHKPTFNEPKNEGLYIYLTNSCNLACNHCYMFSGKPNKDELTKEDWFSVLRNFRKNGGQSVTFTGGEVLKYKDWLDVFKYAKNLGLTVTVLTNGILWDDDKIQLSKDLIDEVQISLDGSDEQTNSVIRGKGNFYKAIDNIKRFVKHGVKTVVATTPTLDNVHQIEKTYINFAKTLLSELQSENLYFKIAQKLIAGRKVNAIIDKEAKEYAKVTRGMANALYPQYTIKNFINNTSEGLALKNCGYGGISITSNGEYYLCNRVEELEPIGNKADKFKDILDKADYYYELTSVDNIEPCKDCELKYICGGGCRIDEYSFKGMHAKLDNDSKITQINCSSKSALLSNMIESIKFTYNL